MSRISSRTQNAKWGGGLRSRSLTFHKGGYSGLLGSSGDLVQNKMLLYITTANDSQVVNLGWCLGKKFDTTGVSGGTIDWGDKSSTTSFKNGDGTTNEKFQHTYTTKGNYIITIAGYIGWGSRLDAINNPNINGGKLVEWPSTDARVFLTKIEIPEGFSSPILDITPFGFYDSQKLTTIPGNLFDSLEKTGNTDFQRMFYYCKALKEIPANLFANATHVRAFVDTFTYDAALTSVPATLFKNNVNVTVFNSVFSQCTNVKQIPSGIFDYAPNCTNFGAAFYGWSKITSIPSNLFDKCPKVENFRITFRDCDALTTIPNTLFSKQTAATNFERCFHSCAGLTTVPSDLFSNCHKVENFIQTFTDCSNITSDVPTLWTEYGKDKVGENCYKGCTKAKNYDEVPEYWGGRVKDGTMQLHIDITASQQTVDLGYFLGFGSSTNPEVTGGTIYWGDGEYVTFTGKETNTDQKFQHTYKTTGEQIVTITGKIKWGPGRTNHPSNDIRKVLTSITIPTGKESPIYDLKTDAFYSSSKLTTIPANLFEHCTEVTDFYQCFAQCTNLTQIPSGLFDKCTNATSFRSCFSWCTTKLTQIPSGLFDKCTKATNFKLCFAECRNLTQIPSGLFDKCTKATDFQQCFSGCTKLPEIPSGLFDKCTNATYFSTCFSGCYKLTQIPSGLFDKCTNATDFNWCFCNDESITSNVPNLWKTHSNAYHERCFEGCTNAANYEQIPEEWK